MTLEPAPLFDDLPGVPAGGSAFWLHADDGKRIRIGHWRAGGRSRGTFLIFPGRTEYVEKYGLLAGELAAAGFDVITIDWRGQGLSDRLLPDLRIGHVDIFDDYQRDLRAVLDALPALGVPQPLYLLGHSMGGCIGLRALYGDHPFSGAVFTGPMWGIRMSAPLIPAAWAIAWTSRALGLSHHYTPPHSEESYVANAPFDGNLLTRDRVMYDILQRQLQGRPELQLGGPSLHWLHEALRETRALAAMPAPDLPCLTFVGSHERIVSVPRIVSRLAAWPGGRLEVIENGEHEVLMEGPETRARILDLVLAHLDTADTAPPSAASA